LTGRRRLRQAKQQERQRADRGQRAHLGRRRMQQERGADRQRQQRDLGADIGEDAAEPEAAEVRVAQLLVVAQLAQEGEGRQGGGGLHGYLIGPG